MKRIMILGAGAYQVPLIRKAKEMGLYTIVLSRAGDYPGIEICDKFLPIDTTDQEKVLNSALTHKIDAITTTGTDVCMPALGKVVDRLGLPGTGFEAAMNSMDKARMKNILVQHSVPTAQYSTFRNKVKACKFAMDLGFPVMVKATDSSGSRGVTKVTNTAEFELGWVRAMDVSRSKEIIVEEFLAGVEFGAQAYIPNNEVEAIFPHRDTVTDAPFYTPVGHSFPSELTVEQVNETTRVVKQAVSALGIKNCIANVDLMLVGQKVKVIEIAARMGATCLPENLSVYTGVNAYECLINLALGQKPSITSVLNQPNASLLLRSSKTGVIKEIIVPDFVLNHPDLVEIKIDVKPGDQVQKFEVGPDRLGHVIVKSSDCFAAESLVESLAQQIMVNLS